MPQSLEKHARICERSANKKRKPFDSAKQRIQGTELAEFLPRQEKKRRSPEEKSSKSWKQTHDDFLQAIRAARNEIVDSTMQKQCSTTITSSAPTRANEQGMCPTCNRHFGVKAYDRHVAWCKERIARVPVSPATNIAKERLEARMKYRAPAVKSRRQATREKYSPGSAITLSAGNKMSPGLVPNKAKESASAPSCNNKSNDSPVKQKTTLVRRSNPMKESTSTIPPMKSRLPDRTNSGKDYDPFLLAEQQMNDLLSDTSEQSVADSCPSIDQNSRQKSFPLSHSSAFVKYPCQSSPNAGHEKRSSSIPAPPTELDDITSDFSSDSTETNSLSRELFSLKDEKERAKNCRGTNPERRSPVKELGRRVIIDKSRALGGDELVEEGNKSVAGEARKIAEPRASVKMIRPVVDRSPSVRASSAPKAGQERGKNPASKIHSHDENALPSRKNKNSNGRNNNYPLNLSSSNLSLSSIISSDVDMKRSNSVFDELMTSFEEDENGAFVPSLKSLLKTDSLSSPVHASRHRNGRISDEELSSPESYKRQDHNKMSGDSAYSSLNRKYSHHGRSTNDVAGRFDEDTSRSNRRDGDGGGGIHVVKCKMSKYCHQCGFKFPETAKFCCECGIRRLVL